MTGEMTQAQALCALLAAAPAVVCAMVLIMAVA